MEDNERLKIISESARLIAKGNPLIKRQILHAMRTKDSKSLNTVFNAQYLKYAEHTERKALAKNYFYLQNNMNVYSMRNRCSAEGHVSHVLSSRMSSRPMGWSLAGAERIARLRAYYYNNGDFAQLVAGAELDVSYRNESQRRRYNSVCNSAPNNYYNWAHVVGIDGITDKLSLKLRKLLNF